jgi:chromate reductase, NAD(P)H dehydrogenase (quinone)
MKILGISGSLRVGSHNARLLRGAGTLLPEGAELVEFDQLGAIPPFNEDEEGSPPASVQAFKDAIAAADGLLIATPEYNSSIPGVLKNALDWASRPRAETPLAGKPAAVIGSSTGLFGAVWAQAETRKVLGSTGARVVDRELPIGQVDEALDERGLPLEEDAREALAATLDELVEQAAGRAREQDSPQPAAPSYRVAA